MVKKLPNYVLAAILLTSLCLMLGASLHDSAIMDELAHIPAGYGYVRYLDYRLNPEHPPLVKALADLPLLLIQPNFPTALPAWQNDVNGQWDAGTEFLYQSGNDATQLIRVARILPIFLTLLLIFFMYFWARKKVGAWWALLPAALAAFSPTILAHGHYVTTDVGAALGTIVGIYFFVKYLENSNWKNLIWAGLAFGFAQMLKFSTVLLIPLYGLLFLAWLWRTLYKSKSTAKLAWKFTGRELLKLIAVFVVGYFIIVYPIYFAFTQNYPIDRQVRDTAFILGSFGGGPTPAGHLCKPVRCLADIDVWMARHRATQPLAQYGLGVLMVLQRADGGNTVYFRGEVGSAGTPLYFPFVYLVKEPLPNLILIFLGLLLGLWGIWKAWRKMPGKYIKNSLLSFKKYLEAHFAEFSMLLFVLIYWAYSIHSTLNIGVRHLMPTIPLMYLLAVGPVKTWAERANWRRVLVLVLAVWLVAECFAVYPYFLSYFNELGGGTWNGYKIVGDSNYDWGQDLLELKDFVNTHPEINMIALDYFGGGNPQYYLDGKFVPWQSSKGDPALQGIHWFAISINTLEQATQNLEPGQQRSAQDSYSWLQTLRPAPGPAGSGEVPAPDYRVGTSIFVYKLQ